MDAPEQSAALVDAFQHIQRMRFEQQVRASADEAGNRVDPDQLHELDRLILKEAFKQIQALQKNLVRTYARD